MSGTANHSLSAQSSMSNLSGMDAPNGFSMLHLCFDETELGDDGDFNAARFIADKHLHVPFEVIQRDLRAYAEHLQSVLMDHIHNDVHEAFVTVCGQLVAMEPQITKVSNPLPELQTRVDNAVLKIQASRTGTDTVLAEAKEYEAQRQFYVRQLHILQVEGNLVKLVKSCESSSSQRPKDRCETIMRAAAEVSQITLMLAVWQATPCKDTELDAERATIVRRIDELCSRFHSALSAVNVDLHKAFQAALITPDVKADPKPIQALLRVYALLGMEGDAVESFREGVVRPMLEEVVSWKASAAARQSPEEAQKLIEQINTTIVQRCVPIVEAAREVSPGLPLLANAVWQAVCDTVMKRMQFLFSPGIPAAFHKHYTMATKLISTLEATAATRAELKSLRESPEMTMWRRKWNLDVYFTLRHSELQVNVSQQLQKPFTPLAAPTASGFHFGQLQEACDAMQWCFGDSVFIYALSHRFLHDAMLVLKSVLTYVQTQLESGDGSGEGAPKPAAMDVLCRALVDLKRFRSVVGYKFIPVVEKALDEDPNVVATVQGLRAIVENQVKASIESTSALCTETAVNQCMTQLANVRSVKATYSMTKKQMPTQPSWFMQGVLEPLTKFKKAASDSKISEEDVEAMAKEALGVIAEKFRALIREIIISARKAQESLEKLKRKKQDSSAQNAGSAQGGRPSHDSLSDRDKMVVQLYLDVHEFGNMLRPFGVHKESWPAFQALTKCVLRAKWILGDEIPEPPELEENE